MDGGAIVNRGKRLRLAVDEGQVSPLAEKREKRLALLTRLGFFGSDTRSAVVKRAVTVDELDAAYRLVHDCFVERDCIEPAPSGLRMRLWEALPEMATFVATVDGKVVGVQSLVNNSPGLGLPSDVVFRDEIDVLRMGPWPTRSGSGRIVCEATNQAIAPAYRHSAVATELMRCLFAHALMVGCGELITAVSPGHSRFYELLGFESISTVRSGSVQSDTPAVLMRANVTDMVDRASEADDDSDGATLFIKCRCLASNPYRDKVRQWEAEAQAVFADPEGLCRLFVEASGLLSRCSEEEREAVCQSWGAGVFAAVCWAGAAKVGRA
jgi:ribosomal protein S18 acetylase RimI-like enzyme